MNNGKSWYSIQAKEGAPETAEVSIHDEIGGWGISARDFIRDLRGLGPVSRIDLSIHSPGGSVFEGWAIYNRLSNHPAEVHVTVEGLAASMASVIAMAGDTVTMPANSYLMIHDPWGFAMGGAEDMRKHADLLDKLRGNIVNVYAARTGLPVDEVERMMAEETWMDAAEAMELGFADAVSGAVEAAAHFDLSRFDHPPVIDKAGRVNGESPSANHTMGLFKKDDDAQARVTELEERISAMEAELTEANDLAAEATQKVTELQAAVKSAVERAETAEKDAEEKQEKIQQLEESQSAFDAKVSARAQELLAAAGHPPVADVPSDATDVRDDLDVLTDKLNGERDPVKRNELAKQIRDLRWQKKS